MVADHVDMIDMRADKVGYRSELSFGEIDRDIVGSNEVQPGMSDIERLRAAQRQMTVRAIDADMVDPCGVERMRQRAQIERAVERAFCDIERDIGSGVRLRDHEGRKPIGRQRPKTAGARLDGEAMCRERNRVHVQVLQTL